MTSDDELLDWLDSSHKICMGLSNGPHDLFGKAAARIRELEVENYHLWNSAEVMREELSGVYAGTHLIVPKPDWEYYKGFHDGVCKDWTHTIVPVEPTPEIIEAMEDARWATPNWRHTTPYDAYKAAIRAAQPGASD